MSSSFSPHLYDVAVIGSGPSGSSAALCLARQGVRVIVLEKDPLPRHKTCGGGVAYRAIQLLPVDIREVIELECYSAELNMIDAGLYFSTKRRQPVISITTREKFDFFLISAARDAGAYILAECKVIGVVIQADKIELITSKGVISARFAVAADGAMGTVAQKAGWQETRYLIPALECEVFVGESILAKFRHAVRFDFGIVPSGYAWVFPKKAHLSVGVLSMRHTPINLNEMLERYLKLTGIDKIIGIKRHGFFIPVSPRKDTFVKGRLLLAGDAAGFADPVTGEGITSAILSGQMAAQALLGGRFETERVEQVYDSQLAKTILPELRLGRILARLIYDYPRIRTWLFRLYGQKLTEAVTDVFVGEKTYCGILHSVVPFIFTFHPSLLRSFRA